MRKTKKSKRFTGTALLLFAGLLTAAFWNGLVLRSYTIYSPKIKNPVTLVLVTDLHSHIYGENQSQIAEKIRQAKPDAILLAGDIADDYNPLEGARQFVQAVADIAPVYYVTGNHEIWSGNLDEIKQALREGGAVVLENSHTTLRVGQTELRIAGLEDPDSGRTAWAETAQAAFAPLKQQQDYTVLLSHRPEKVTLYAQLPVDLIVSGHAHGGQVRIPFLLNGLLAPNQGLFPQYAGGLYEYEGKTHVVSRGVSYHAFRPRVFNPPEIVVVNLQPTN